MVKAVSDDQIVEFFKLKKVGKINGANFQLFLENPDLVFDLKKTEKAVKAKKKKEKKQETKQKLVSTNSLDWWKSFYKSEKGIEIDLTEDQIPARPTEGNWRLIVVTKGMTPQGTFDLCTSKFKTWKYTDRSLDTAVPTNDRDPNKDGTYAIWVRDVVEADEQFKNISADMAKEKDIKGVTLLERLLHELAYWSETGKHLDSGSTWTLCTGSRDDDGDVPDVRFCSGEVFVRWSSTDDRYGSLRLRQAVSK